MYGEMERARGDESEREKDEEGKQKEERGVLGGRQEGQ